MSSQTEIYNLALAMIGDDTVSDTAEDSAQARALNAVWQTTLDGLVSGHPWNFALARASLAADATAPVWKYARAFTLPSDCLMVKAVDTSLDWKVETNTDGDRRIVTDEAAPLNILYIRRVDEVGRLPPPFVDALAAHLAYRIAFRITEGRTLVADLRQEALRLLGVARTADAQEGRPEDPAESDWILVRGTSRGWER